MKNINKKHESEFKAIVARLDAYDKLLHVDLITSDEYSTLVETMRDTADAHGADIVAIDDINMLLCEGLENIKKESVEQMILGDCWGIGILEKENENE